MQKIQDVNVLFRSETSFVCATKYGKTYKYCTVIKCKVLAKMLHSTEDFLLVTRKATSEIRMIQ